MIEEFFKRETEQYLTLIQREINRTPTGPEREDLTELQIHVMAWLGKQAARTGG